MITKRTLLTGMVAAAGLPGVVRAAIAGEYIRVPVTVLPVGRVHLPVTINGQGPYTFVMDTGAYSTAIRKDLARTLKLPFVEGRVENGVGGTAMDTIYRAKSVLFGDKLRQSDVSLSGTAVVGHNEDGLIAAGFLTTMPSELDFGLGEIRIYIHGRPDLGGYIPVRSYLDGAGSQSSSKIYVYVTIDGISLKLEVDTGASSELLLFPSTVKKYALWNKYPDARNLHAEGVTGAITATRLVNMPNFALSDVTVPHLPVTLMDPAANEESSLVDGLLGSRFLKLFSMAVLPNGIALRPNAQTVITPDTAASSSSST